LRLGGAVHGLAEHRLLERIIRGRAWIAILAVGLIGIVFMQVSMLRTNAGIGAAVETAGRLERENSAMRATISALSAGDRIEAEAFKLGLILAPGTPRFLDARVPDARRAIASMTVPGDGIIPLTTATDAAAGTVAPTHSDTGVAPSSQAAGAISTSVPVASAPAAGTATPTVSTTTPSTVPPLPTAVSPTQPSAPTSTSAGAAPPGETGGAAAGQGG